MTKISIVLYYWILVAASLLFAKTAGLMDNDTAIIKILVVVTIIYAGIVMTSDSMGKTRAETQGAGNSKRNNEAANGKGKKKK